MVDLIGFHVAAWSRLSVLMLCFIEGMWDPFGRRLGWGQCKLPALPCGFGGFHYLLPHRLTSLGYLQDSLGKEAIGGITQLSSAGSLEVSVAVPSL